MLEARPGLDLAVDVSDPGEHALDVGEHLVGRLGGVHALVEVPVLVEVDEGRRLLVVGAEAGLQRLGVVVGALDQRLPGHVVDAGDLEQGNKFIIVQYILFFYSLEKLEYKQFVTKLASVMAT